MQKIEIPLGNGVILVASEGAEPGYKEIFIGLEFSDNNYQDLAVIGEEYKYESGEIKPIHDRYSVKVYADSNQEDFTNDFRIDRFTEWDE